MELLQVIILSAVEGFTEFLPVSSTAHLILTSAVLNLQQTPFLKSFELAIQLGAILAVVALYIKQFLNFSILQRLAAAFLPTALIGLILYKLFKALFVPQVALWALLLGGLAIIIFERYHKEPQNASNDLTTLPLGKAALVGLFQAVAIVPGVSRAAATICGGLLLGVSRATIVKFSFLLAVPTMLAATLYDLIKNGAQFSLEQWQVMLLGGLLSALFAAVGVKFLLRYIQGHNFTAFGWYRIVLALIGLLLLN